MLHVCVSGHATSCRCARVVASSQTVGGRSNRCTHPAASPSRWDGLAERSMLPTRGRKAPRSAELTGIRRGAKYSDHGASRKTRRSNSSPSTLEVGPRTLSASTACGPRFESAESLSSLHRLHAAGGSLYLTSCRHRGRRASVPDHEPLDLKHRDLTHAQNFMRSQVRTCFVAAPELSRRLQLRLAAEP